ncbi:MAG: hypothetical protein MI921_07160 [Cytophagales bacterium]|nr:hypothetical protein [Cytophagales bacterium]
MQEKNRHILNKIMASLPKRKAPARIWAKVSQRLNENREQGQEHLEKAMESIKLEEIKAPDIWRKISGALDKVGETDQPDEHNTSALKAAIRTLPQYSAPGDLFDHVVNPARKTTEKGKSFKRLYRISGVAATVVLVLTLGFWLKNQNQKETGETITYSEETIQSSDHFNALISSFEEKDEVLAFVEANCLQVELKCENAEFKGLLLQYKELDTVKQSLIAEITLHQEQVQLIDYLIRVEKEKTEIGKKLIQYILS